MSREGWLCPKCGRGVSPDEKTCDHGGEKQTVGTPIYTAPGEYGIWPGTVPRPFAPPAVWPDPGTGTPYNPLYTTCGDIGSGDPLNEKPHSSADRQ